MADRIMLCTANGDREVRAHVVGAWAAHRSVARDLSGLWSVTHVPSGRLVGDMFVNMAEAKAVADALHHKLGDPYPKPIPRDHEVELTPELKLAASRILAVVKKTRTSRRG